MSTYLAYLSFAVSFISVFISGLLIYNYKKVHGFLLYFGIWSIAETILEITSTLLGTVFGIHNIFLFHINAFVEFIILILYFHTLFKEINGPGLKKYLWPGLFLIVMNSLFLQGFTQYNSNSLVALSLGVVFISLYYFIKLFETAMDIENKMFRLILTGAIMVIHSTQLIPLLFGNTIIASEKGQLTVIWIVRAAIVLIIKLIIFYTLLGHFMHSKKSKLAV